MRYRSLFLVLVGLLVCSLAYADVPKLVNFQGRLTDASGKFVPDGNYSLTFRIYTDSTGGSAKWSEGQLISVSKGLFNVILGTINSIPDSIFNYKDTWLGIQVGVDPEMTPRQRLSSLGYSYRTAKADTSSYSMNSDKLDGLHASDFTSPVSDYGRSGVAVDLYEGTVTLTDKYVNETQANSITSAMITDNQIVDADISASANILPSKISGTAWTSNNDGSGSNLDADFLDGQNSSAFLSTSSDYGRSGVATDLYEGTSTLTSKYINEGQANSITSGMITDGEIVDADISASASILPSKISGTAWTSTNDGSGSGLDADLLDGQQGSFFTNASNLTTGTLADGRLSANVTLLNSAQTFSAVKAFNPSSGTVPFTVDASKNSAVTNLNADLLDGQHSSAFVSTATDYGRSGVATDLYEGASTLASKYVNVVGPDSVYSTSGTAFKGTVSGSSGSVYGIKGYADNTSSGAVYGGYFETSSSGTGTHYGLKANAYGSSSSTAYGVNVYAENSSSGYARGGYFATSSSGTGVHYGLEAYGMGASTNPTYGVYGYGENTSSGIVYGGFFSASSDGTGIHYGIRGAASGNSSSVVYASYGYAQNSSNGDAYGGFFTTSSSGTGRHYGIGADAYGSADSNTYGCDIYAQNNSTGDVYGGYFQTNAVGTGYHYAVRGIGRGASATTTFGIVGSVDNTSSGNAYGGQFYTSSSGTGDHYGIWTQGAGSSASTATYGIFSDAYNTSTATVYAGYFSAEDNGTGTKYGVYSYASTSEGYAGYFAGDMTATGTKSAAVKVDNGEYRMLYCQESPENWFEDFGEGQMVNGEAHIELDPVFLQTVTIDAQNPMKVFIQLRDDCKGTYVKTYTSGFDIFELQGGTGNAAFSYRVVAKRKGYENIRLAKMMGQTPEEIEAERIQRSAEMEREMAISSMAEERQELKQEKLPVEPEREDVE